jgi:hypothetical protein
MNAEFIELNDSGKPGTPEKVELPLLPRIGELVAVDDEASSRFFEVVNVIHHIGPKGQNVRVYLRTTKEPYQESKTRFGFGSR